MKNMIKSAVLIGLLAICLMSNVYATEGIKVLKKDVLKSEENQFLTTIEKEYSDGNEQYKLLNYSKEDDEENLKIVTAYKKDVIKSNKKEAIIEHFGETLEYSDSEYSGTINIKDYEIKTINNARYEDISEKTIPFSKYSKNDLDNIEKEKIINGITYYLINVDWNNDETEIIDNQVVPLNYKGKMIYQAIVQKNYPSDYEITVAYEGTVNKKNPKYTYIFEYEKIKEQEPIIEEKADYTIPIIIISGVGVVFIILYFINSNTAKVYCKTDNGYKLVKIVHLSKNINKINLDNCNHKIKTNMYAIKTTNGFYNKNKNMIIRVHKDKITKNVYLNSAYVDFILG